MGKMIPDSTFDLALARIQTADIESICSTQPMSFFEACRPDMWVADTVYIAGAVCRAPTDNDTVYECIVGGTSGSSEPAWSTTQDATFTDGTVTWKAHFNFSLATCDLDPGDKVIEAKIGGGRTLIIAEKTGVVSHRAGTITHTALINSVDQTIEYITTATTTAPADDDIIAGRTTIFHELLVSLAIA